MYHLLVLNSLILPLCLQIKSKFLSMEHKNTLPKLDARLPSSLSSLLRGGPHTSALVTFTIQTLSCLSFCLEEGCVSLLR